MSEEQVVPETGTAVESDDAAVDTAVSLSVDESEEKEKEKAVKSETLPPTDEVQGSEERFEDVLGPDRPDNGEKSKEQDTTAIAATHEAPAETESGAAGDAETVLKEKLKQRSALRKRKQPRPPQDKEEIKDDKEEDKENNGKEDEEDKEEPTAHLRIDNFLRPLTLRVLAQWLGEVCGQEVFETHLWLNAIKTHCYLTMPSVAHAQRARKALAGRRFPETNPLPLVAHFTRVSAEDAPQSVEAQRRPGEWRQGGAPSAAPARARERENERESRNAALKRKLSEATDGGAAPPASLFKKAAKSALGAASPCAAETATEKTEKSEKTEKTEKTDKGEKTEKREGDARPVRQRERERERDRAVVVVRHTAALPSLAWSPVSEEVAQSRIELFKHRMRAAPVK